jgi:hypothetical protein
MQVIINYDCHNRNNLPNGSPTLIIKMKNDIETVRKPPVFKQNYGKSV